MSSILVKTSPIIDNCGELFTIKDFIDFVNDGAFVDSDGMGYYASEDGITDIPIRPSDVFYFILSHSFTHVMWYNK